MAKGHGIVTEKTYPYKSGGGNSGTCKSNDEKPTVENNVNGYKMVDESTNALMNELVNGPVAIAVDAALFQSYTSGVIKEADCGTKLDHGVQVVGYTENTWLVRNSWGENWGEKGFVELEKGKGVNTCGILSNAVVPTLSDKPLPPAPTPAKDSCKDNCGKSLETCGCGFMCEYLGVNCCDDYKSYCGSSK